MHKKLTGSFILLIASIALQAQTDTAMQSTSIKHQKMAPLFSVGMAIGHARVFDGRDAEGKKKTLTLPLWGVDLNYQFSHKWMAGIHTDLLLESFAVEKHLDNGTNGEVVERTRPIAPAAMIFYKPTHHWSLGLGAGEEFAKEANYFLNRVAIEYGVEIRKGWEVFGSLRYDIRWKAYDTWSIGLGISKSFGKNKINSIEKE